MSITNPRDNKGKKKGNKNNTPNNNQNSKFIPKGGGSGKPAVTIKPHKAGGSRGS